MAGKSKIYILTSAGFKAEGIEYSCSFPNEENAWLAYAELLGKLILEKRNKSSDQTSINWINKPRVVSYEISRFNSGNGILKKKVFNIYSRFTIQ